MSADTPGIEPIFVRVPVAAQLLAISEWSMYELCKKGVVKSEKLGRRRLVDLESLRDYAKSLSSERDESEAATS